MFLLSACLLALAFGRYFQLADRSVALLWALAVGLPLLLLLWLPASGIASFATCLVLGVGCELVLWRRGQTPEFRYFAQNLGIFAVALAVWVLDIAKIACMPSNHWITGHAIWHVLNALAIERLFTFYQVRLARVAAESRALATSEVR
jgi:hypothetical protein